LSHTTVIKVKVRTPKARKGEMSSPPEIKKIVAFSINHLLLYFEKLFDRAPERIS